MSLQKNRVTEELNKIQSNFDKVLHELRCRTENVEKELERHSKEIECLHEKVTTEQKENYSEFVEKKGINLFTLKHEIFMQHTLDSVDN